MRIHLTISKNSEIVPFNHIPILVGSLHKWLGENDWHGKLSHHSFSWLKGAKPVKNGLTFSNGAEWFISSYEPTFIKTLITGIQEDPTINFGLTVRTITIQEDPSFTNHVSFRLASPVLIKRSEGNKEKHFIFSEPQADTLMTETMINKLKKAGVDSSGIKVYFQKDYPSPKTKLVNYNGIGNRANFCPVIIEGTPQQIAFAWNVGVGNSTGIGFGALN